MTWIWLAWPLVSVALAVAVGRAVRAREAHGR